MTEQNSIHTTHLSYREDLASLCSLAQERPPEKDEIYEPNTFYGNAQALKNFLQMRNGYTIKAAMEHSAELGHGNWMLNVEAPLPAVITMSPYRHQFVRPHTDKPIYAIGPYVHYSPHALDKKERGQLKARLGRNLLAFPAHSTTYVLCEHNIDTFCDTLREIGRNFDSTRVCIYWADVLNGTAYEYARRGFECVTCGHMYDPKFLPRLKSMLDLADLTVSNALTTALGYSIFMGKPHYLHKSVISYSCKDEETFNIMLHESHLQNTSSDILEIEEAFSLYSEEITERQQKVAAKYWGFSSIHTKQEMTSLFHELENMYNSRFGQ